MQALIYKATLLAFLVLCSYALLIYCVMFRTSYEDQTDFYAAINDKYALLAETSSPKIVLIGGSSLAFGIDSEIIKAAIHMPVVNLGLHANMGMRLMMDSIKGHVNENDVIVIVPEYAQFYRSYYGEEEMLYILHARPQLVSNLTSYKQFVAILRHGGSLIRRKLYSYVNEAPHSTIYNRQAFNRYGDVISHLNSDSYKAKVPHRREFTLIEESFIGCKDFQEFLHSKKAVFALIYPTLNQTSFDILKDTIDKIDARVRQENIVSLSTPEANRFADKLFFDTNYHLNSVGRKIRTEQMVQLLKSFLNDTKRTTIRHGH